MKKNIILVLISIVVGILLSFMMFNQYDRPSQIVSLDTDEYYFIQLGVYSNYENMINNTSKLENYIYLDEDNKYYVFTCITRNADNQSKLQGYFTSLGYTSYSKVFNLSNSKLKEDIDKSDLILNETNDNDSIKELCKQSLNMYKEDK